MCHGKAQQALLYIQPIFCLHLAAKLNVLMLPTYIQHLYVWSKIDQFFPCEAIQFIINYTNHSSPSNSIQFEINWMLISHTFYKICLFCSNIFGLFPPPQICLYPSALCAMAELNKHCWSVAGLYSLLYTFSKTFSSVWCAVYCTIFTVCIIFFDLWFLGLKYFMGPLTNLGFHLSRFIRHIYRF